MGSTAKVMLEAWDAPDGTRLRAAQRAELDARYGCDDHEPGVAPSAADVTVFLVARSVDGAALGCGCLRRLDGTTAEIKRMYVEPAARGTGVSVAVLRALEEQARQLGCATLVLETGTAQPDAIRFYEREGYQRTEGYGPYRGNPLSVCFTRTL